jgi:hypothetical protein
MRLAFLLLVWIGLAQANLLRVPGDLPGIQAAFDASAEGDTVLVSRGTWTGLLQSPVHSILFCSNYLFSLDSTDINETILDGAFAGTILTVNTVGEALLSVVGFTMSHGMSIHTGGAYCETGGAVRMEGDANACFTDIVFSSNHGEYGAAVIHQGNVCSGLQATGDLTLRRIFCVDNSSEHPESSESRIIWIRSSFSRLIIDNLRYDCGNNSVYVMEVLSSPMDSVAISNTRVLNGNHSFVDILLMTRRRDAMVLENVRMDGCVLNAQFTHFNIDSSFVRIANLDLNGESDSVGNDKILNIRPDLSTLIADSITVHNTRSQGTVAEIGSWTTAGTLRHFQIYDNVVGDSAAALPGHVRAPMVRLSQLDLLDAHIHDNRIIIPADPDIGQTDGNYLVEGGFISLQGDNSRIENVLFDNNSVEDLDDYQYPGSVAPRENDGRELYATTQDTLRLKNIIIRSSHQPNWCPEWVGEFLSKGSPGTALVANAPFASAENILIENCDDGGLSFFGREATNIVLRNVGRMGALFGNSIEGVPPAIQVRNLHIENVDLADDRLQPEYVDQFGQYALGLWGLGNFENVTITGCDSLRFPIKLWFDAEAQFHNSLFWDNDSGSLAFTGSGGTASWNHCLAQEILPGEGNLVGLNPQFDPDLGAPFLAANSPCIDAGDPDPTFNDREDPAVPGFALWPSLGGLSNDIGFTGGPHAAVPDTTWSALPRWGSHLQPATFMLGAPWPNPFNPVVQVPVELTKPSLVRLEVFNVLGQQVAVLQDGLLPAGRRIFRWAAAGQASGLYFVTLTVDLDKTATRAVTLLR